MCESHGVTGGQRRRWARSGKGAASGPTQPMSSSVGSSRACFSAAIFPSLRLAWGRKREGALLTWDDEPC